VHYGERVVTHWPNGKGKSIFKYLVTRRRRQPVSKDVLMEQFWPDATPQCARNNLNVAIFGLRQAVSTAGCSPLCVLFRDGCYGLNPDVPIWIDYEVFRSHVQRALDLERSGQREAAMRERTVADMLYRGDFMDDSRYEDWLTPLRQSLREERRRLLDQLSDYHFNAGNYEACVQASNKMVTSDACDEGAHRRLMRCYAHQGLPHLALRQYQLCIEALDRELQVTPSAETVELAAQIRRRRAS
jgi:DNA-binding SARP family transcriptional activator